MKKNITYILMGAAFSLCLSALAAPKDEALKAVEKLAAADNYTWKSSWQNSQFGAAPTVGRIDKAGLAVVSRTMRDNTILSVHQGDKAATETQDGWRSLAELEADQGGGQGSGRFAAMMLRGFRPAAEEAKYLVENCTGLSLSDGVFTGKLSEEAAKSMASFRRGRRGGGQGEGPEVSNAAGSVKLWVDNGVLKKYEYTVSGTMSFNGQDRDIDRTMLVEISDVGSTKVEVPEGAKAKL